MQVEESACRRGLQMYYLYVGFHVFIVKAGLASYIQTNILKWKGEIIGHIYDVSSGQEGEFKVMVEEAIDDSINDQHTVGQRTLFVEGMMQNL